MYASMHIQVHKYAMLANIQKQVNVRSHNIYMFHIIILYIHVYTNVFGVLPVDIDDHAYQ